MAMPAADRMRQVHLGLGSSRCAASADDGTTAQEQHAAHEALLLARCPPSTWPHGSCRASCPRPILVTAEHGRQLAALHGALAAALNDIVPRWWRDVEAAFPQRMPLADDEGHLLQWLDEQQQLGRLRPYATCQGAWRPDFLIEEVRDDNGRATENFRVSEINARFCFNGFMHVAYGSAALEDMGAAQSGLVAATDGSQVPNSLFPSHRAPYGKANLLTPCARKIVDGLLDLFERDKSLHILKGDETGIDMPMFVHAARLRLGGRSPRVIAPGDLRLSAPDAHSRTTLCCLAPDGALRTAAGERVEEVHQVALELRQRELRRLDRALLRALSLRCVNDMRTVLLVHDKRMLGVVLQELGSLTARGVLTPAQAAALNRGIAHTILPGSPALRTLDEHARHEYLLKPVRGGKGAGILFGEDMTAGAWRAALARLREPGLRPDDDGCVVVQRRVRQIRYEVVLKPSGEAARYPLVGTYHVVNGRYLGMGIWRSSGDRICAVSTGGSWMCSVMSPC
ncbi:taurine catabolism dioxygenase [Cordyceps militaris]|uniref:Taurine catabolism dioxygenase n=1 Tax=Cordyceps militaris TaxID=73501 RepID=A0A2H4SCR8_CORMI|nr:taurine catabolism dioxygenase [Cordyceps militaris]